MEAGPGLMLHTQAVEGPHRFPVLVRVSTGATPPSEEYSNEYKHDETPKELLRPTFTSHSLSCSHTTSMAVADEEYVLFLCGGGARMEEEYQLRRRSGEKQLVSTRAGDHLARSHAPPSHASPPT